MCRPLVLLATLFGPLWRFNLAHPPGTLRFKRTVFRSAGAKPVGRSGSRTERRRLRGSLLAFLPQRSAASFRSRHSPCQPRLPAPRSELRSWASNMAGFEVTLHALSGVNRFFQPGSSDCRPSPLFSIPVQSTDDPDSCSHRSTKIVIRMISYKPVSGPQAMRPEARRPPPGAPLLR